MKTFPGFPDTSTALRRIALRLIHQQMSLLIFLVTMVISTTIAQITGFAN
jgi:hypothetical protein